MILVIDNYDSFTYNLVQYLGELGAELEVFRNDGITLEKIKKMKDKSFEEAYILQQEAKYRQAYLDPNKKKLEDDMKGMLNNFTSRLNGVLKTSDKK